MNYCLYCCCIFPFLVTMGRVSRSTRKHVFFFGSSRQPYIRGSSPFCFCIPCYHTSRPDSPLTTNHKTCRVKKKIRLVFFASFIAALSPISAPKCRSCLRTSSRAISGVLWATVTVGFPNKRRDLDRPLLPPLGETSSRRTSTRFEQLLFSLIFFFFLSSRLLETRRLNEGFMKIN